MGRRGFFAALAGMLSAAAVRKLEPTWKPEPELGKWRFNFTPPRDFPRILYRESGPFTFHPRRPSDGS